MKKLQSILCACMMLLMLSACSVDSKIESYQKALEEGDFETAADKLSGLDAASLKEEQLAKINSITDEFLPTALDKCIGEYDNLLNAGKADQAMAMWDGVPAEALTAQQVARLGEINMKFAAASLKGGAPAAGGESKAEGVSGSLADYFAALTPLLGKDSKLKGKPLASKEEAQQALDVVIKVVSSGLSPMDVKPNVSAAFDSLYRECSQGRDFIKSKAWGMAGNAKSVENPTVVCMTAADAAVKMSVSDGLAGKQPVVMSLVKEKGKWVVDNVLSADGATTSQAAMKDYLSHPHDGMLLSEAAKLPGLEWIVNYMVGNGFEEFSITVKDNTPEGVKKYQTTAKASAIHCSGIFDESISGLTKGAAKKIWGQLSFGNGSKVITVTPDYFTPQGKIVKR